MLALVANVAGAASEAVDPDKLPMEKCSSIVYAPAFLNKYPKAPAACLEVRVYKGQRYMKIKGKVYVVDKNAVTVAFYDPYGNDLGTVTVSGPNYPTVFFDGKNVAFPDLKTGEKLTIWVPESIFSEKAVAMSGG
jgi:hypothetical protein